ncbi:Transcriptional adapter ada2 [Phlyctochytrium bullatum]|nr:Transcriptional adapter ada2 [Phlyctochytrium bullatum]
MQPMLYAMAPKSAHPAKQGISPHVSQPPPKLHVPSSMPAPTHPNPRVAPNSATTTAPRAPLPGLPRRNSVPFPHHHPSTVWVASNGSYFVGPAPAGSINGTQVFAFAPTIHSGPSNPNVAAGMFPGYALAPAVPMGPGLGPRKMPGVIYRTQIAQNNPSNTPPLHLAGSYPQSLPSLPSVTPVGGFALAPKPLPRSPKGLEMLASQAQLHLQMCEQLRVNPNASNGSAAGRRSPGPLSAPPVVGSPARTFLLAHGPVTTRRASVCGTSYRSEEELAASILVSVRTEVDDEGVAIAEPRPRQELGVVTGARTIKADSDPIAISQDCNPDHASTSTKAQPAPSRTHLPTPTQTPAGSPAITTRRTFHPLPVAATVGGPEPSIVNGTAGTKRGREDENAEDVRESLTGYKDARRRLSILLDAEAEREEIEAEMKRRMRKTGEAGMGATEDGTERQVQKRKRGGEEEEGGVGKEQRDCEEEEVIPASPKKKSKKKKKKASYSSHHKESQSVKASGDETSSRQATQRKGSIMGAGTTAAQAHPIHPYGIRSRRLSSLSADAGGPTPGIADGVIGSVPPTPTSLTGEAGYGTVSGRREGPALSSSPSMDEDTIAETVPNRAAGDADDSEPALLPHCKSTTSLTLQRRSVKPPVCPAEVDVFEMFKDTQGAPAVTWPKGGPMTFTSETPMVERLSVEENLLCRTLRLLPEMYLGIKEVVLGATFTRGVFKKKDVRRWFPIDVNKINKLYDWFLDLDWIPQQTEEWDRRRDWLRQQQQQQGRKRGTGSSGVAELTPVSPDPEGPGPSEQDASADVAGDSTATESAMGSSGVSGNEEDEFVVVDD